MRFLLLAAALSLAVPAAFASAERYQIRYAADLVDVCDTNPRAADAEAAAAFCHGYLVGAFHFYDAAIPPEARFACAPDPTPSRSEVMNGFVTWAKAHPQHMQERAVETLFRFLATAYPCPY
jgi:hypothetical protein